jgi:hypothetical protein
VVFALAVVLFVDAAGSRGHAMGDDPQFDFSIDGDSYRGAKFCHRLIGPIDQLLNAVLRFVGLDAGDETLGKNGDGRTTCFAKKSGQ